MIILAEYIDKQGIIDFLKVQMDTYFPEFCDYATGIKDSMYHIRQYPLSDVAPVKHGKWEMLCNNTADYRYCSECGYTGDCQLIFEYPWNDFYKYCPHCGAKMDLKG